MTVSTQFEPTDGDMVLANAILLYRNESRSDQDRYARSVSSEPTFASIHPVDRIGGAPVIGAGAPLSRAHLRQWTEALGRTQIPDILPGNVLVSHPDLLAWWVPAAIRTSYFKLTAPPEGLTALASQVILPLPYPAHVFVATRGRLGVYALAKSERPTADTVLLHSPVLNVYVEGHLCWGNIPQPKALTTASMPEYERAVFDSWSTHPNIGQEGTVTGKGGLVRLWDGLAARKATRFPVKRLKPFGAAARGKTDDRSSTLAAVIKRSARS